VEILAINDPFMDVEYMVYQFKYDSVHGRYPGSVEARGGNLVIDGHEIRVFSQRDVANIGWGEVHVDYVLECSGVFLETAKCMPHIEAGGAKKVIISAPAKDDTPLPVMGVNHETYHRDLRVEAMPLALRIALLLWLRSSMRGSASSRPL
jgi:glyceraldehyde 3-phosphate dehydrogenase